MDSLDQPVQSARCYDPATQKSSTSFAPPEGFCDCTPCNDHFRTNDLQTKLQYAYFEAISNAEAHVRCISYAKDIQDHLGYLRDAASPNGITIINRWKKFNRDKRATIVREAFPSIFPDECSIPRIHFGHKKEGDFREAFLLPWLTLDVLRDDPFKFLSLLHFRTKFGPEDWVAFDVLQTRLG
jgi:hypothetical protein